MSSSFEKHDMVTRSKGFKGFVCMVAFFVVVCLSPCAVISVILSSVMKDKPSESSGR